MSVSIRIRMNREKRYHSLQGDIYPPK
ncbi:hypothetical protein BGLA2_190027 [Burkholderia gladioli]|nr:hypothetical protein BGLA2_190027 [Burkholderia gladioli]